MSRSSDRGQLSPFTALAAVLVLSTALSTYALAFETTPTPEYDRERAAPVLADASATLRADGAVSPAAVSNYTPPSGVRVNLTLRAPNGSWSVGAAPPRDAAVASRQVPVRVAPGRVRPGRLRATVWR